MIDSLKDVAVSGAPSFELPAGASNRGVLVVDTNDCITFADSNIFHLLDVPSDRLLGKSTREAVANILRHCFSDGEAYAARWQFVREHPTQILDDVLHMVGSTGRTIHRYSAPIFGKAGECVGRVEIYSDITKRRELETAVRHAYEELRTTQDQLIQSEKLRAVGEIASGVAHDFNNTLGIILGNLQLLLRNTEDSAVVSRLQSAERAALDAVDTVRRIQEFTRTRPQEPPSVLDLSKLASEVVEMMKPVWQDGARAQGRDIDILLDLGSSAYALGNAPELREVLTNVLLNAVQAMPNGGSICISTGCSNSSSWVQIADSGIGMPDDVKNRVFDPFFTTRGVEGTGLGMSVAYGIIKRHGGRISIESAPGKGTSVTIFLPAAAETQVMPDQSNQASISISPARILVVDDEEMFAAVLVEMLSECGHAVCVARSGSEALEQFRKSPFDLVFTDLGMPEMSGWQVARNIKDLEPETPVVLLTGWGATLDKDELEASSVDLVLSKPIKLEDLSAAVAEMQNAKLGNRK